MNQPIIVAAFEGWNDAGEAATEAVRRLREAWGAVAFVDIDPEEFYDFTQARPRVRLDRGGERKIEWPRNQFAAQRIEDRRARTRCASQSFDVDAKLLQCAQGKAVGVVFKNGKQQMGFSDLKRRKTYAAVRFRLDLRMGNTLRRAIVISAG